MVCDAFSVLGNYNISVEKQKVSNPSDKHTTTCDNVHASSLATGSEWGCIQGNLVPDVQCAVSPAIPHEVSAGQHGRHPRPVPPVQSEQLRACVYACVLPPPRVLDPVT